MNEHILTGLVSLFGLGALAQILAWRAKIPSILALLATGVIIGPWLDVVAPHELLGAVTFPLVSLGAAMVLFEGGLSARWQDLKNVRGPVARLVTLGMLVTWCLTTAAAHYVLHLSLESSSLLGAVLVVTGPTVIGPILRHARPQSRLGHILQYEGIINDPLGAILALLVFQVIQVERVETAASLILWGVFRATVVSALIGLCAARLYVFARKRNFVPQSLENAVLLPTVFAAFALANHVQPESGLLAVTVMGVHLASQQEVDIQANIEFAEHLRTMLISVLFILLTARIEWSDLAVVPAEGAVFVLLMILVVRPLSVFLSCAGSDLSKKQKALLAGVAPRGIVAAAVSSVFALRLEESGIAGAELLMPLTFMVIASCVLIYGLGTAPLVRILGLSEKHANGVLFLGANRIARTLGECLQQAGVYVMLVDTNRGKVMRARRMGLNASHGHLLADHTLNRLDFGEVGQLVALTPSDDANTVAVQTMKSTLGAGHVAQIECDAAPPGGSDAPRPGGRLRGQSFAPTLSYEELAHAAAQGKAKLTPISEEFTWSDYKSFYEGRAVPLLILGREGRPRVLSTPEDEVLAGERVLSLVSHDESSAEAAQ